MKKQEKGLIVCDPKILNGKPVIKGTRISVALILQNIATGMNRDKILADKNIPDMEELSSRNLFLALTGFRNPVRVEWNHGKNTCRPYLITSKTY